MFLKQISYQFLIVRSARILDYVIRCPEIGRPVFSSSNTLQKDKKNKNKMVGELTVEVISRGDVIQILKRNSVYRPPCTLNTSSSYAWRYVKQCAVFGERASKVDPTPAAVKADATRALVGPSKRVIAMGMPIWIILVIYISP